MSRLEIWRVGDLLLHRWLISWPVSEMSVTCFSILQKREEKGEPLLMDLEVLMCFTEKSCKFKFIDENNIKYMVHGVIILFLSGTYAGKIELS